MSSTDPIGAVGSATVALAGGERRSRVLEYLCKATSALEGVAGELERSPLTPEDREAIMPALETATTALSRVDDTIDEPAEPGDAAPSSRFRRR